MYICISLHIDYGHYLWTFPVCKSVIHWLRGRGDWSVTYLCSCESDGLSVARGLYPTALGKTTWDLEEQIMFLSFEQAILVTEFETNLDSNLNLLKASFSATASVLLEASFQPHWEKKLPVNGFCGNICGLLISFTFPISFTSPIYWGQFKGAGASEAPGETKEEFSINDTSRDPKVLKIGPQHGWQ